MLLEEKTSVRRKRGETSNTNVIFGLIIGNIIYQEKKHQTHVFTQLIFYIYDSYW